MPGASRGDPSMRRTLPTIRVPAIAFSPTGRAFCAATTEGLLIYSLDNVLQFDPFDLDIDVTPANTLDAAGQKDYLRALIMAFRLNEAPLIRRVYENIPIEDVSLLVKNLPRIYLARLLRFVAHATDESPHLEFNLRWIEALLSTHGPYLKQSSAAFAAELRTVQKAISRIHTDLARLADDNVYIVDYLLSQPTATTDGVHKGMSLLTNGYQQQVASEMDAGEGEWIGLDDEDSC